MSSTRCGQFMVTEPLVSGVARQLVTGFRTGQKKLLYPAGNRLAGPLCVFA